MAMKVTRVIALCCLMILMCVMWCYGTDLQNKESYARLMTAQHLCRTYTELVNCERLTKNHKLNLRKIYAKLTQNLGKT